MASSQAWWQEKKGVKTLRNRFLGVPFKLKQTPIFFKSLSLQPFQIFSIRSLQNQDQAMMGISMDYIKMLVADIDAFYLLALFTLIIFISMILVVILSFSSNFLYKCFQSFEKVLKKELETFVLCFHFEQVSLTCVE